MYMLHPSMFARIMLLTLVSFGDVLAQSTLTTGDHQVAPGEQVRVSIELTTSQDLRSLEFSIDFNSNFIEFVDGSETWASRVVATGTERNVTISGSRLTFSAQRSNAAAVNQGTGDVVQFSISGVQAGTSPLTFSNISAVSNATGATEQVTPSNGLVRVISVSVAFQTSASEVMAEFAGIHRVPVQLSITGEGTLTEDVSVDVVINSENSTAMNDEDFNGFDNNQLTITFDTDSGNLTTQFVEIMVLQDTLVEGTETIALGLDSISGSGTLGELTTHSITLIDDDQAFIQFKELSSSIEESTADHPVVVALMIPNGGMLANPVNVDVSDLSTETGTATAGDDYTAFNTTTLTFPNDSSDGAEQMVNLAILDDSENPECEGDETVKLQLANLTGPAEIDTQSTHTVRILENEPSAIAANFSAIEGEAINLKISAERVGSNPQFFASVMSQQSVEDYSQSLADGFQTGSGGTLTGIEISSIEGTATATMIYDPPSSEFRGVDRFFFIVESDDTVRSCEAQVTIATNVAPWYPVFTWESQPSFQWYNIRVFHLEELTDPIFETNINGLEITPREYLLAGFNGFTPGDYRWQVRGWDPIENTFGDPTPVDLSTRSNESFDLDIGYAHASPPDFSNSRIVENLVELDSEQVVADPPVTSSATGIAGFEIDTDSNILMYFIQLRDLQDITTARIRGPAGPGENGDIQLTLPLTSLEGGEWNYPESLESDILEGRTYLEILSTDFPSGEIRGQIRFGSHGLRFLTNNARGFDFMVSGDNTGFTTVIQKVFSLDEDGLVVFNEESMVEFTPSQADTYRFSVRGFNPLDEVEGLPEFTDFPEPLIVQDVIGERTPDRPTGLFPKTGEIIVLSGGNDRIDIDLSWNPTPGAVEYFVYLGAMEGSQILNFENVGNATSVPVSLMPGNYSWMVIASNPIADIPFGRWSDSQSFEVVATIAAPVITSAERDDGTDVTIGWAPGAAPQTVDVFHYNAEFAQAEWRIKTNLNVTPSGGEETTSGTFDLEEEFSETEVDYLLIRGTSNKGETGKYKLFILP